MSATAPELDLLALELDAGLATLTLDRPESLNAMSPELLGELRVAANWLADQAPARALVITGAGRAFSAGGDVTWFKRGLDDPQFDLPGDVRRVVGVFHEAIVALHRIDYPVIAAINGVAAGGGLSLALACDLRIAAAGATLHCAYERIGASPDGGMSYFLPRILGPAKALELMLTDPDLTAAEALELGLVSKVVADGELVAEAQATARRLAAKAPHYVRMTKLLVAESLENGLGDQLELERRGIAESMATENLRVRVTAFLADDESE